MSKTRSKEKTFKLITGILIPIFIMVSCIVMVGVSYAWFSPTAETSVSSITLSTKEAFTLSFDFGSLPPEEQYEGQQAYLSKQGRTHLVTSEYAMDSTYGLGYTNESNQYQAYMQDAPYTIGANVLLDTQGKRVDFKIYINSVNIYMEETTNNVTTKTPLMTLSYMDDLIEYGFTWYLLDTTNSKIYSPYGTQSQGNALNIGASGISKWNSTPSKQNINNFVSTNESTMKLYVVFCPEKLYWMQYSNGESVLNDTINHKKDWVADLEDVYTSTDINKIYYLDNYPNNTGVTYWDPKYVGAKFEFNFTVEVLTVHEDA